LTSPEFTAAADKYDRFMGRYTASLAPRFVDAVGIQPGCGFSTSGAAQAA
jgi:hypothetical protein